MLDYRKAIFLVILPPLLLAVEGSQDAAVPQKAVASSVPVGSVSAGLAETPCRSTAVFVGWKQPAEIGL